MAHSKEPVMAMKNPSRRAIASGVNPPPAAVLMMN
jgi:hypothetical protein